MSSNVVAFLKIFLVIALIISPQVAVARELAQTPNTITSSAVENRIPKSYGGSIPIHPKSTNDCSRPFEQCEPGRPPKSPNHS